MTMTLNSEWQTRFNQLDSKKSAFLQDALSLLSEIDVQILHSPSELKCAIQALIVSLDQQLSTQMDKILHHPAFSALYKNWRHLNQLAVLSINHQRTRLKLLDMGWQDVSADLNQAYSIRSSELYNKIGNKELNTLGGHPFGCVVFAHSVSLDISMLTDYDDLFTLELLSKLGESTLCPMILSPDSRFFANNGADWLSDINRIDKILNGPDYTAWQSLRNKPSARFLGLVMPNIQLRPPYLNAQVGFMYNENSDGVWGNSAFAFISVIMREHHRVNWFGFLKSRWNDKLQGAVVNVSQGDDSAQYLQIPQPDIHLFGKLATFYASSGFIPLTRSPMTDKYYFSGNNSVWQAGENDNERVLTQIQTTLMSCRIAHYLKVQVREMIGSFNTAAECEQFLSLWIEKYTSNVSYANEDTLARYPLSFAKVSVGTSASQTGTFHCTLRMVPQYQFDHFSGEVVLTTELEEASR
ncbi:type VI secretion system contractile sheath domain-containing protein [Vibrio sp. V39_P1S14PM300]|uniref:type VI secretion system contractile sheath domain-containing protein n=1 Tax=Vibrio sp. V39_P1S14PM300 TaxID=1938690 RepID=UPI001372C689|nr:type VI secretion system contractile sheath large subunit [Vibrio sp. V39_P1S14PM300]NAX22322.1 hypothetical protein [Vibrio sp. V39_P1S14PM300]